MDLVDAQLQQVKEERLRSAAHFKLQHTCQRLRPSHL